MVEFIAMTSIQCSWSTDALSGQAPPFTLENVFEAVKAAALRSWYHVGRGLLGMHSPVPGTILLQRNYDKEACLKAVVEAFLRGEGAYQLSWRRVIHTLYCAGETRIAQGIISYAEPVEGERAFGSMLEQHLRASPSTGRVHSVS